MEHALAKGVNGLDLQPTRRVERVREQLARPLAQFARYPARIAGAGDAREVRAKGLLGRGRPFREATVNALDHLRRADRGVGQAQDAARRDTGKKQAHHARGQNVRFARARIGRNPGRMGRVRRAGLALQRDIERIGRRGLGGAATPNAERFAHGQGADIAGPRVVAGRAHSSPAPSSPAPSSSAPPVPHSRARARWS